LQIVDDESQELTISLQLIEQIEQPCANGHGVGSGLSQRAGLQLIDDPIGEKRFRLIATNGGNGGVRMRSEELGQQSRLARPSLAFEKDDLRLTRRRDRQFLVQDA
jgi:hypothetical protein